MSKPKLTILILLVVFNLNVLAVPIRVQAATDTCDTNWSFGCPIISDRCTDDIISKNSECGINDMIATMIHITQWILAVLGSAALAMFVYGGFIWVTAAGNTARVDKGRKVLVGTVVGIIIVLGAFTLVRFLGKSFGVTGTDFNKYLDTSSTSSSNNICRVDGERCRNNDQNVYACSSGSCSETSLCAYWAPRSPNPYGLTALHRCLPQSQCASGTEVEGLCPGATPADGVCCRLTP